MPSPSLLQIVQHTPLWVFALLAGLGWMGVTQMRPGRTHLVRALLMPLAMGFLSLYGMFSTFGGLSPALASWVVCGAAAFVFTVRRPVQAGVAYDPAARQFRMPGSAVPLLLTLGIFFTKYTAGVAMALHPALVHDPLAAPLLGMLYGTFSGIFAARAARLILLAQRSNGSKDGGHGGEGARFA
ncbi:MAG: DUF6622 family protein [Pseudomonadota bacterium]